MKKSYEKSSLPPLFCAVVDVKAYYPILKGLYYRNAHHTQKVLDFITSSLSGVPVASEAGVAGSYIQDKYHPKELLR
ncbi:hypothetical protein [uncultured Gammaproteobacteria bacterium]|jgi:hypothetical protein|nr:hypothetical protein [uncultured Gammaproteobacteria bacterium]CAC9551749.1 hypothetical protein [uncultured Gammaproteobacteria bacterium]CAC9559423.1 hypothetical protein [uncultured Gammaproteobacteria bacterium]CAC9564091.1 hypothetical protein [uncultured Gammaproteobacteria bacterium]CAC9569044.1 hypothetical protein [uncultured Gammaproteobacteria bacterium]